MKGNCSGAGGYVKGSLFKIREIWLIVYLDICREINTTLPLNRYLIFKINKTYLQSVRNHEEVATIRNMSNFRVCGDKTGDC
jgi:hypothetical protein